MKTKAICPRCRTVQAVESTLTSCCTCGATFTVRSPASELVALETRTTPMRLSPIVVGVVLGLFIGLGIGAGLMLLYGHSHPAVHEVR